MERQLDSPWHGFLVKALTCWACQRAFGESDEIAVVDAANPKLVHAERQCRDALTPLHSPLPDTTAPELLK